MEIATTQIRVITICANLKTHLEDTTLISLPKTTGISIKTDVITTELLIIATTLAMKETKTTSIDVRFMVFPGTPTLDFPMPVQNCERTAQ